LAQISQKKIKYLTQTILEPLRYIFGVKKTVKWLFSLINYFFQFSNLSQHSLLFCCCWRLDRLGLLLLLHGPRRKINIVTAAAIAHTSVLLGLLDAALLENGKNAIQLQMELLQMGSEQTWLPSPLPQMDPRLLLLSPLPSFPPLAFADFSPKNNNDFCAVSCWQK
jgi:hypothetical protein